MNHFRHILMPFCLLILVGLGGQNTLWSQCLQSDLEIFGISAGDRFGRSVAVSGGRFFVGAIGDDGGGTLSGSVRSFRRTSSGYQLENVFSGQSGSEYGSSIAANQDWLAIGAAGLSYIDIWKSTRFGWELCCTIEDPEGHADDGFGSSIAFEGDLLAVGSPTFQTDVGPAGCVTLWRLNGMANWEFEERLEALDRVSGDNFGTSISIHSSGQILVGSPGRDGNGIDSGVAFLYSGGSDGWTESAAFGPGIANEGDRFGTSVSLIEDFVFIGCPFSDIAGPASGMVASYRKSNAIWILQPLLLPNSGVLGTGFGATLVMEDNLLAIGAPMDMGNEAMPAGKISIYAFDQGWNYQYSLAGNPGGFLGTSIAIDRGVILAGAPLDSSTAILGGGAKFIVEGDFDCDSDGITDACAINNGTAQDCDLDGIPDQCAILAGWVTDCDNDLIPDSCSTLAGNVEDCDADGVPDSCSTQSGLVDDCDQNSIPDICQGDCNFNGIPDPCEIFNLMYDCNLNGQIDECEIDSGALSDCDGDGVPDICENDCNEDGISDICSVLSGLSEDCNNNLLPDECDLEDPLENSNANDYVDFCEPKFIRGDADGTPGVRLADAVLLISRVFGSTVIENCEEAADANADGFHDISDGLYLLFYEFAGGAAPPGPFPECGIAPASALFPCTEHPSCP